MADKPDWFKLYPSRFLQDGIIDQMTTEELGCCVRLMCRQWLDGSIPDDLDRLARICRLDRSGMGQAWVTLCQFFPPLSEGTRANRFMFIERELVSRKMEDKSRKGLEAATKRWDEVRKNKDGSPMPNPLGNPMQDTDTDTEKKKTPPTKVGLSVEEDVWHSRLRSSWPKNQYDGNAAPYAPPKETSRLYMKHRKEGKTGEEIAWCGHIYAQRMQTTRRYLVSLATFLGPQGYLDAELEEARVMIASQQEGA